MGWTGRRTSRLAAVCLFGLLSACNVHSKWTFRDDGANYDLHAIATQIEYADVQRATSPELFVSPAPRTVEQGPPTEFWDLTLDEVIAIALHRSPVIRDLGGRALTNPGAAPTIFDPAIQESDPRFGPEGALSAFDAQLATSMFWSRNDQAINNIILGGGAREIVQDLGNFQAQLTKTTATGTQLTVRNQTQYDQSNQPGNLFTSSWDTQFELSLTQPLLQGAGITFNRIAGPNATVGLTTGSGVLIARINTDISLADFETGVRNFISDLEDAYWDLYFAYRDLDAKLLARDSALETWRAVHAKFAQDLENGQADREAQAREQYFLFQDLVQDALSGAPAGGQSVGVYRGERRLRLLMGLPATDGRLIRPADEPSRAKVVFDWQQSLTEALTRRVELRRQMWQIKRRELELIAARNFTLPQFDAVALYRWRGFGDDLTGGAGGRFGSAFKDLRSGDHQEWQLGLQFNYQFGYRQAWAAVRQAELQLARERAVLKQQELEISHGLSDAVAELSRAHAALQTSFNRLSAAVQRRDATDAALKADRTQLEFLLQAQRALSDAQTRYFQSLALYARAVKNVHLQKGSLLEYHGIYLSEGAWPHEAYADAGDVKHRWRPKALDYRFHYPRAFSHGAYAQHGWSEAPSASPQPQNKPEEIPPGRPEPVPAAPPQAARRTVGKLR